MDNYEINILRRNGNWNKITQDDGVMNNNEQIENKNDHTQLNDDFKFYLNEVSSIIKKIEDLEKDKENLKDQLKIYEQEFINNNSNFFQEMGAKAVQGQAYLPGADEK